MQERISINHIPGISAIYFALLQCGYGYYAMEKEADLAKRVETFCMTQNSLLHPFFLNVKQNTCAVYPYWPRAALLESATFFLDHGTAQLKYYEAFRQHVMSMSNLSETERNEDFWAWIADFPAALTAVLGSSEFRAYWHWEHDWIMQQNMVWEHKLHQIESILHTCAVRYRAPKRTVSVILNPIKCVYSADYHIKGSHLIVCSGAFSPQSVVHECLHPIVGPAVEAHKEAVLQCEIPCPDIDSSYYLDGDAHGRQNAFEEYAVRELTSAVFQSHFPQDLHHYIASLLRRLS